MPKKTFPLTTEKVVVYISWLLFKRKVKAKSVEVHLMIGHENPALRPGIVKIILNGQNNIDKMTKKIEGKSKRVAVTIPILKLIKKNIKKSNLNHATAFHPLRGAEPHLERRD